MPIARRVQAHGLLLVCITIHNGSTSGPFSIRAFCHEARLRDTRQRVDKGFATEYLWTQLISEHVRHGRGREGLRLYKQMRDQHVTPKSYTFVAALKACCSIPDLEAGMQIHSHAIESGIHTDIFVSNTLIDMYAKCGSIADAHQVFEKMQLRNVVSWNSIITGYAQQQAGEAALHLYVRMRDEGFLPNNRTFVAVLKACSGLAMHEKAKLIDGKILKMGCLKKGRAIHSQVVNSGFEADLFVASTLVDLYAKCGSMIDAFWVFETISCCDVVAWNAMMMGCAQMEEGALTLQLYERMQHEGMQPDAYTFVAALMACGSLAAKEEGGYIDGEFVKSGCLAKGKAIHSQVTKSLFNSHVIVSSALVDMYVKCGSVKDASQLFEKMPYRDVVSWTAMIMAYAQMGNGESALRLYACMQHECIKPDSCTFVAVLKACTSITSLEIGKGIHADICTARLQVNPFVVTSLVDMYSKCGSMVNAQLLFDRLPTRDIITWNTLIAGYSGQGDSKHVFDLFEKMRQECIPDSVTFVSLLNACSHAGLVEKGQNYFQAMCKDHGILATSEHYHCMIDLLGRAGQLEETVTAVKMMPVKSGLVTWTTFLSACRKWGDVEVARHAFDCAVRLEEKQAATDKLMTNIYASIHLWEEMLFLRK